MNEKKTLALILIYGASLGAINNSLYARAIVAPVWWQFVSILLFFVLMLAWYHCDSIAHGYERTKWLNAAMLFMALLAIPYYLIRSREKGQRIAALLRMIGFVILFFIVATLSGFVARYASLGHV